MGGALRVFKRTQFRTSVRPLPLTTQSRRSRDQRRFAKFLVSAYFLSTGDIHRYPVTDI
jgi:hypothetical protein